MNCGHNAPLVVRSDGRVESLESGGPLLGVIEDARFEAGEVHLAPGAVGFEDDVTLVIVGGEPGTV